jgi:hypothetical protein
MFHHHITMVVVVGAAVACECVAARRRAVLLIMRAMSVQTDPAIQIEIVTNRDVQGNCTHLWTRSSVTSHVTPLYNDIGVRRAEPSSVRCV